MAIRRDNHLCQIKNVRTNRQCIVRRLIISRLRLAVRLYTGITSLFTTRGSHITAIMKTRCVRVLINIHINTTVLQGHTQLTPSREKPRIYRKDDALNKFQESIFGSRRCNIDNIHIYSFIIQFHTTLTFCSNIYLNKIFQAIECFIIHFKFIMCMGQRYATIHMHHTIHHDKISFKFFHF